MSHEYHVTFAFLPPGLILDLVYDAILSLGKGVAGSTVPYDSYESISRHALSATCIHNIMFIFYCLLECSLNANMGIYIFM